MGKIILLIYLMFLGVNLRAQMSLTQQSVNYLVNNVLMGGGVTTSNITYTGLDESTAMFTNTDPSFQFTSGILLTNGLAENALGPNNSAFTTEDIGNTGDADIEQIAQDESFDATIIEFDFIPNSDTISFRYIFASEEYMEYVGFANDAFGFFISGPGITGPFSNNSENMATIPGTNQYVTINNVNLNVNSSYYINNQNPAGDLLQYDGFTVPFIAKIHVQCGQTYHLKIVIADVYDDAYDSGVFLEGGSFTSTSNPNFTIKALNSDTVFSEGCTNTELILTRPTNESANPLSINLTLSGEAVNGVDYSNIPLNVIFAANEDTIYIPFSVFSDDLNENAETLTINTYYINSCSGDTVFFEKIFFIKDAISIDSIVQQTSSNCQNPFTALGFVSNTSVNTTFQWSGPSRNGPIVGDTLEVSNLIDGWYYLTASDGACFANDSIFIEKNDPIASFHIENLSFIPPPVNVIFINDSQNASNYSWIFGNGTSDTTSSLVNQEIMYDETGVFEVTLIAFQGLCSDTFSLTIELFGEPQIFEPNIFSPNEDGINDVFSLSPKNFKSFDFLITNRWGNIIFEGNLSNKEWDGTVKSGEKVSAGTYFYSYNGIDWNNKIYKNHGILQVVK